LGAGGLANLSDLSQLERLSLTQTKISDKTLEDVAKLRKLKWLGLAGTAVTDKGLAKLSSLSDLKELNLTGSRVTADGVKEAREALPNAHIEWKANDASPPQK
jgi:hypothetical protein